MAVDYTNSASIFAASCVGIFVVIGVDGKCGCAFQMRPKAKQYSHWASLFNENCVYSYKLSFYWTCAVQIFTQLYLCFFSGFVCFVLFSSLASNEKHTIADLITIIALLQHQKLRGHVTTAFVLSLCISDLLFCSISMPLTAARYMYKVRILIWRIRNLFCVFNIIYLISIGKK